MLKAFYPKKKSIAKFLKSHNSELVYHDKDKDKYYKTGKEEVFVYEKIVLADRRNLSR